MKILERLQKMLSNLEDPKVPFIYPAMLFVAGVSLRNFLEIFSDQAKISFNLFPPDQFIYYAQWVSLAISLLHYYLFWIALCLALGVIFHLLTQEGWEKIFRVLCTFFIILIITPAVDLLTTWGAGRNIMYVEPQSIRDFLFIPRDLTPGMVCTSWVALLACFLYGYAKTRRWWKGLICSLVVYILLLALSVLPRLLGASHPLPITRALMVIIMGECALMLFLARREYFRALAKDLRWLKYLYFQTLFIAGIILAKPTWEELLSAQADALLLTVLATSLGWLASVMFNNLSDVQIDAISNPSRPLISGKIPQATYLTIARRAFLLALACGLLVNFQTFFLVLVVIGNSILYSLPPLRLKRVFILSKIFSALNSLCAMMLGYIFAGGEILKFPEPLVWYFLVFVTLILNFIDIKDYEGDRQQGIATLPVVVGLPAAKIIIAGLCLLGYAMISLVLLDMRLLLPALLLGGTQFFLITRKNYSEQGVLLVHCLSTILVVAYLALAGVPF